MGPSPSNSICGARQVPPMSKAATERAYMRSVISKFGSIIKVGTAVQIPRAGADVW